MIDKYNAIGSRKQNTQLKKNLKDLHEKNPIMRQAFPSHVIIGNSTG